MAKQSFENGVTYWGAKSLRGVLLTVADGTVVDPKGMSVRLVEQNAPMALELGYRAYVLESAKIVLWREAKGLKESDQVRRAYLGL